MCKWKIRHENGRMCVIESEDLRDYCINVMKYYSVGAKRKGGSAYGWQVSGI